MSLRGKTLPAALLLAAAVAVAGCGSSKQAKHDSTSSQKVSQYSGAVANPPKPAPALILKDSTGKKFDLAQYRGKTVLITFLYTHCPDVCPLIAGNLHTSLAQLGSHASRVQVVAVSADPKGDTPKTVAAFLAKHQLTGKMRYLIGSRKALEKVWLRWGIVAKPDPKTPNAVEHSGLVYGIAASGKITTLYPANFKPADIVHDVPILAAH
ncbi:MAG: SCO family protein [Actinobacteria bacterium]|nr:MAG: SCO family protein [Actinomycetota bacterium]